MIKLERLNKNQQTLLYFGFFVLISGISFLVFHFVLLKSYLWLELLVAVNLAAFLLFGVDKAQSYFTDPVSGKTVTPRLPERLFYLIALLGGSPGILLGMRVFRHKTRKVSFQAKLVLIIILQVVVIYLLSRFNLIHLRLM